MLSSLNHPRFGTNLMTIATQAVVVKIQTMATTQRPSIILPHPLPQPAPMEFNLLEIPSRHRFIGQGRIHNPTP